MSKLSFRARPLEASKPMPIFMSEELPDLPEYSAINRAVPQMPSGMKKEEECEHHLQRAMVTGLIIPTPEVIHVENEDVSNRLYAPDYKVPRQLIHMQPFTMEQDIPDYDMDSEDEKWLAVHSKTMDIDALKFEEMMDRLEKNSGHSVVTQMEAKVLLKEDDDLIMAVYDYWLNKRLRTQQSLIPCVKTETHRGANSNNNPYLAFRRRTEKMQTRKNRKNDETTYEKMVKLKRDLSRALTLLELVKRRENTKRELLHLTVEVYEKRHQAQDYSGQMLAEVSAMKTQRPAFAPLFTNQYNHGTSWSKPVKEDYTPRKEKRQYKKRKHKNVNTSSIISDLPGIVSSGDDDTHAVSPSPTHDEIPYTFQRKRHCTYNAPLTTGLGNWSWCSREEGGLADHRFKYNLTSLATPSPRCIGRARRRLGRGGRVILDRAGPPKDDFWESIGYTIHDSKKTKLFFDDEKQLLNGKPLSDDKALVDIQPVMDDKLVLTDTYMTSVDDKSLPQVPDSFLDWPHFRPKSPTRPEPEEEEEVTNVFNNCSLSLAVEDLEEGHDYVPVNLNLGELFPSLTWDTTDQEVGRNPETITPPNENDEILSLDPFKPVEPINSDILLNKLSFKADETELDPAKNMKRACIDKKEFQGGSLLDRWARFESPPPEPIKKRKSTPEPFLTEDLSGCSAFRTSNCWTELKLQSLTESSPVDAAIVEDPKEPAVGTFEDTPNLPPTPPKESNLPSAVLSNRVNNITTHTNGSTKAMSHSRFLSKHLGPNTSYRKKNNHLHSHRLNNKLIMRLPESTGNILETTVSSQVLEKNPNEALMRKSTQMAMEVT